MASNSKHDPSQCFAFEKLREKIDKRREYYKRHHKRGDLGKMPQMHVKADYGITIPTTGTSDIFHGGIVDAMANFEEFVKGLYDEAADTIKRFGGSMSKQDEFGKVKLHNWMPVYSKLAKQTGNEDEFFNEMVADGPIVYYYILSKKMISKVEIKDKILLCAILRLFYGIRCVMAHGCPEETLKNPTTLRDFPFCESCDSVVKVKTGIHRISENHFKDANEPFNYTCSDCETPALFSRLMDISYLSSCYDECIKGQGKEEVLKSSRFYPGKKPIQKLPNGTQKNRALKTLEKYFKDIDDVESKDEVDENYAIYHMCRIFHWLKQNKRDMYVTYGLLARINEFILMLADRMRITTATILMKKHGYKSQDGTCWGVPEDATKRKTKIDELNSKHKRKIRSLKT